MNDESGKTVDERINNYFADTTKVEEQPAPMPSADQTTGEPVDQPVPEGQDVQAPQDEEVVALENSKNPERTKSYIEKLKKERDEALAKTKVEPEIDTTDYGQSVFDSFRPAEPQQVQPMPQIQAPYLNPLQVENIQKQFVDEQGNVDIAGVNRAINEANRLAYESSLKVQSLEQKLTRVEESDQVRDAHAKVPEIDPQRKDVFNPKLYELVKDRLLRNMWEGKQRPLAEVATEIKSQYFQAPAVESVKEEAVAEYKKAQEARNQGPIDSGRARMPEESLSDLRTQTRRGGQAGDAALEKRLKALGIV